MTSAAQRTAVDTFVHTVNKHAAAGCVALMKLPNPAASGDDLRKSAVSSLRRMAIDGTIVIPGVVSPILPREVKQRKRAQQQARKQSRDGQQREERDKAAANRERLLRELAPGARFLHVASHGFFAPESIPSRPAAEPEPIDRWLGLGTPASGLTWVRGLSPMILAGLALSGANRGPDAGGRLRGVVTARFPVSRTRAR